MHRQETIERYRTGRSHPGRVVLEGFHALKHALRFRAEVTEVLSPAPDDVLRLAERLAPDVRGPIERAVEAVPRELFRELAPRPPGTDVLALARRPDTSAADVLSVAGPAPVVALEEPSHLGNLGAAVRVAAAAGAAGVVTTGEHDPWHASALRGSAGLHFALPVAREERPAAPSGSGTEPRGEGGASVGRLAPEDRPLVAVDPDAPPFPGRARPTRALLAFGSERRGLRPGTLGRADLKVRIPMREGVSSLNLATSVAAVLYGWRRPGGGGDGDAGAPAVATGGPRSS